MYFSAMTQSSIQIDPQIWGKLQNILEAWGLIGATTQELTCKETLEVFFKLIEDLSVDCDKDLRELKPEYRPNGYSR